MMHGSTKLKCYIYYSIDYNTWLTADVNSLILQHCRGEGHILCLYHNKRVPVFLVNEMWLIRRFLNDYYVTVLKYVDRVD